MFQGVSVRTTRIPGDKRLPNKTSQHWTAMAQHTPRRTLTLHIFVVRYNPIVLVTFTSIIHKTYVLPTPFGPQTSYKLLPYFRNGTTEQLEKTQPTSST
jgi:hypothetical protein